MNSLDKRLQMSGFITFFLSGICSISSGIIVSLLQERYGFDYNVTGTLLSIMSIGNLMAGFATGVLPAKIGLKATIITLSAGYELGYLWLGISGWMSILVLSFLLIGFAKGSVINMCTILVSNHSENRAKGMNIMHSCYALGALICPFVIAGAGLIGPVVPMFTLGFLGLIMWIIFHLTPFEKKTAGKKEKTDWGFLKSKRFWLLTGLIFCQNAAETSVNGWLVTYFKGSGILSGTLSAYTVTVMWTATLIGRLLIAFVFPLKNPYTAMIKMGIGCTVFGKQPGSCYSPAFRLCFFHGRHEPNCRCLCRKDDQRSQHRCFTPGCQLWRHPDAMDHWYCLQHCGTENGYGNEYYFLCGNADILYRCKKLKRRIINIFPVFDRRGFFELS